MKVKVISIILAIIIVLLTIFIAVFIPHIDINGKSELVIEYNNSYKELGAKANYLGKNLTNKIKISGKVNTKKIGKYEITYKLKYGIFKVKKKRIVKVIDKTKPLITLDGDTITYVCPDTKYKEEGYTAYDEYDKDLTDRVKVSYKDDRIIYSVSDNSKNKYEIERKLIYDDIESPNIELNGGDITVVLGNSFKDPGYKVSDNCSKDLNDKVNVSGSVDTSKEGTYEIKYSVKDNKGNYKEVIRKVKVLKKYVKKDANLSCGEAGVIYLTFDDGPNNINTPKVLNTLKKHGVKATFFITNNGSDALVKREYDEGHLIAIHTATHNYSNIYKSSANYWHDFDIVNDRIERITGSKTTLFRFPGGSSNTVSRKYSSNIMTTLTNQASEKGYTYFDWNLLSGDSETSLKGNYDGQYNLVIKNLSKQRGNIILMHDIQYSTADNVLDRVITYGINNGYTFKVLDQSITCHQKVNN